MRRFNQSVARGTALAVALTAMAMTTPAGAQQTTARPGAANTRARASMTDTARARMQRLQMPIRSGSPATRLLRLRSSLNLTDEQVQRLENLQKAGSPSLNRAEMLRAQADLLEATRGEVNLAAARKAMDRMSAVRNDQAIAALKARQDARAVLTADQKARYDNMNMNMRQTAGRSGAARTMRGFGPAAPARRAMPAPGAGRMGLGPSPAPRPARAAAPSFRRR